MAAGPLEGVRIVDLTTLLPGPLATRLFADAGAEVVKIERPGGEDMKRYPPFRDGVSLHWTWLNVGKRIVELDLKDPAGLAEAMELISGAAVVVEQFRPGVMARLGLGPADLLERFPNLVVCSITGYGQTSLEPGHDLNYQARAGLLNRAATPHVPTALIADVAGGTYPAVVNILLALRRAEQGGGGCHLDISMTGSLTPFLLWPLAMLEADGVEPPGGKLMLEGASPRYGLYPCADGELLAVAALEDAFWRRFTSALDLTVDASREAVAGRLAEAPLAQWWERLRPLDCCVCPLSSVETALAQGVLQVDARGPGLPLAPQLSNR